jgi:hypothetical protein
MSILAGIPLGCNYFPALVVSVDVVCPVLQQNVREALLPGSVRIRTPDRLTRDTAPSIDGPYTQP